MKIRICTSANIHRSSFSHRRYEVKYVDAYIVMRIGFVMKQLEVAWGMLFCCCCSSLCMSVCLFCQLTNWIISSEFKPLLPLPLQSFSLSALLFTSLSLSFSARLSLYLSLIPSLVSLCSQHQDLKQHG